MESPLAQPLALEQVAVESHSVQIALEVTQAVVENSPLQVLHYPSVVAGNPHHC